MFKSLDNRKENHLKICAIVLKFCRRNKENQVIKLLTINLNYYHNRYGDWITRKEMLVHTIRDCNPDIIALQAVKIDPDQYDGQDQAAQLSKSMPKYPYHHFIPILPSATDGLGFISKVKSLEIDTKYLSFIPGLDDPNHRIVLRSAFDFSDSLLQVFNCHFSWVYEQTEANIQEVISYTNHFQGYKVLAGDFNTTPDSDLFKSIKTHGWVDVWDLLYPGKNGFTFETQHPAIRIDYVWVAQDLINRVIDIEIVSGTSNQSGKGLSDHFGLLATFDL